MRSRHLSGLSFLLSLAAMAAVATASAQSPASAAAKSSTPAMVDTIAPPTVRESSYSIRSGPLFLPGTLTLPAGATGKLPVVLIVSGSGPTDRNGNSIAPGYSGPLPRPNMYAQLAWRLAEQGIGSVRYDKRSLGENLAKIRVANTSIDDFIGDVDAAARQLSTDARFSRVVLLGHSEGAELVLQAVNRGAPAAGIVMASGAGRRFVPILHSQLSRQLDSATLIQYDSAMAAFLRNEAPKAKLPAALMSLFQPDNRKFMQGMQAYVPTEEIAKGKLPILIVQGANDVQIGLDDDARPLAAAQPRAKLVVLPTANHVLKAATGGQMMSQLPLYMNPRTPIVPELAPAVAAWIRTLN